MIADIDTANRPLYNFKIPVASNSVAAGDPLFASLVATRAFKRLKKIRFLGGIDYLKVPWPNGHKRNTRYTRYQHSLGVAALAHAYCEARNLPLVERHLVVAAALLHDVGHAPLSHSLEPVFDDVFRIDHHRATIAIIRGKSLGTQILETLCGYRIDVERLVTLISGGDGSYDGFFCGPINFDTIEGVLRTQEFAIKQTTVPSPEAVMIAAMRDAGEADRDIVDEFWQQKDLVYRHVINSEDGVLADHACQAVMRSNIDLFRADDYFSTEDSIFKKLPGLKKLLTSPEFKTKVWTLLEPGFPYKARRFFVERTASDKRNRYRQEKHDRTLSMPREVGASHARQSQDRFV
jgi:uncharacterized protein